MAQLLRKIDFARWQSANLWLRKKQLYFFHRSEVSANVAKDYSNIKDGTISFFETDGSKKFNERIIAAMASIFELDAFGWVVVDSKDLSRFGLKLERTPSKTADNVINEHHYNLVNLSMHDIANVSLVIAKNNVLAEQLARPQVFDLLVEGLFNNELDIDKFINKKKDKPALLVALEKRRTSSN